MNESGIIPNPTGPEADDIVMALEEYIYLGDFPATKDNCYAWGHDAAAAFEPILLHTPPAFTGKTRSA